MADDDVFVHGVRVGRVRVKMGGRAAGKTVSASVQFHPDRIGILHAFARSLDKERDQ